MSAFTYANKVSPLVTTVMKEILFHHHTTKEQLVWLGGCWLAVLVHDKHKNSDSLIFCNDLMYKTHEKFQEIDRKVTRV